jgi:multicomponent Na+:H+ antiporter subunit G
VTETLSGILFLAGATLGLLAAVGVLRMPDVFTRMQASTKAATLGLGCLLAGLAIQLPEVSVVIRAGSIGAFVMLTTPVAAHVIARAAFLTGVPLWKGTLIDERRRPEGDGGRPTP